MSGTDRNRRAYNESYDATLLELRTGTRYDRTLVGLRNERLRSLGTGRDAVDLGCGTGSYLVPNASCFRSVVGIDFSPQMLEHLRSRFPGGLPANVRLLEEDIGATSLPDASVDLVFSFSTLYHVPGLDRVLAEVARVLRPGGRALLELGNRNSLNVLVWDRAIRSGAPWAEHHGSSYRGTRRMVAQAGLAVERWRCFQLLPYTGIAPGLRWLYPIAHPWWKKPFGVEVAGRMLDEWLSSLPLLRAAAFRHLVELRKP